MISDTNNPEMNNDTFSSTVSNEEKQAFIKTLGQLADKYAREKPAEIKEWLTNVLTENDSRDSKCNAQKDAERIIETGNILRQKQESLCQHVNKGERKESWLLKEAKTFGEYEATVLNSIDESLKKYNNLLLGAKQITTVAGTISQSANLHGFVAEQYHVQTFNLNAAAAGSNYRAEIVETGLGYTKNGVDIRIIDAGTNTEVPGYRYQCKYCASSDATENAFHGDHSYNGQRHLIPNGQKLENSKYYNFIESPDGIKSQELSYEDARKMAQDIQDGNKNPLDWDDVGRKTLCRSIISQAGIATALGFTIGAVGEIIEEKKNGESIDFSEVMISGAEQGGKVLAEDLGTCALKILADQGKIMLLKPGTPISTIAGIVHVSVEGVVTASKVADGELTPTEGFNKMEDTVISTTIGIACAVEFAKVGGEIGRNIGVSVGVALSSFTAGCSIPVCAAIGQCIGNLLGSLIGHVTGSAIGHKISTGIQRIRRCASEKIKTIWGKVKKSAKIVKESLVSLSEVW